MTLLGVDGTASILQQFSYQDKESENPSKEGLTDQAYETAQVTSAPMRFIRLFRT